MWVIELYCSMYALLRCGSFTVSACDDSCDPGNLNLFDVKPQATTALVAIKTKAVFQLREKFVLENYIYYTIRSISVTFTEHLSA